MRRGCNNVNEVLTYTCFLLVENLTIQSLLPLWRSQAGNFCTYFPVGIPPTHFNGLWDQKSTKRRRATLCQEIGSFPPATLLGQLFLGLWLRSCVVTVLFSLIAKLGHRPYYHHDFSWLSSVCACATRTTVSVDPHFTTRRGSPFTNTQPTNTPPTTFDHCVTLSRWSCFACLRRLCTFICPRSLD